MYGVILTRRTSLRRKVYSTSENSSQNICKIKKVFIILHHVSHRHRQSRYDSAVERRGTDSEYYDESSEILRFTSVG